MTDAKSAIRWVKLHVPELGVDPGRDRDREVDVFEHLDGRLPEFLFLFGSNDHWKPASDRLFETLKRKRAPVRFLLAPDRGHGFWIRERWHGLCLAECNALLVSMGLHTGPSPEPSAPGGQRLTKVR